MFVGHAMLAFALVAGGIRWAGYSRERSLSVGLVAGAFATVPDVDMLYALSGLVGGFNGVFGAVGEFWSASTAVHRAMTHSLPVGIASAIGFALWSYGIPSDRGDRPSTTRIGANGKAAISVSGFAVLLSLAGAAGLASGSLGVAVMTAFVLAGLAVATVAVRSGGLGAPMVIATALLGLLSHPFGDLLTGEPPRFFYPLGVQPVAERVALSADPTLHLLGAFGIELATIWVAAFVYCRLTDRSMRRHVHWRAAFGVAYAGAAVALPAPTIASSYRFVFSVLAVGIVGPAPLVRRVYRMPRGYDRGRRWIEHPRRVRISGDEALTPVLTGLAAVTIAGLSFAAAYAVM